MAKAKQQSETKKNPVGRPRTTLEALPENWKDIMKDCAQGGGSQVEARCLLGITKEVWYTLLEDYEEFRETVKACVDLSQVWWERTGRNLVITGQGNAVTWIFNMKNRFPEDYKDRQEVDHKSTDGTMSPKESVDAKLVTALVNKLVD